MVGRRRSESADSEMTQRRIVKAKSLILHSSCKSNSAPVISTGTRLKSRQTFTIQLSEASNLLHTLFHYSANHSLALTGNVMQGLWNITWTRHMTEANITFICLAGVQFHDTPPPPETPSTPFMSMMLCSIIFCLCPGSRWRLPCLGSGYPHSQLSLPLNQMLGSFQTLAPTVRASSTFPFLRSADPHRPGLQTQMEWS